MSETIPTKHDKARVKKGRYEAYIAESLASKGNTLIRVNWNKKTVHYLDAKRNKRTCAFYGI